MTTTPTPSRSRSRVALRGRFGIAAMVLGVILVAVAVLTVVLLAADRKQPFSSFSADADDPVERSQQVADHVSARYLSDAGQPLVSVQAGEADTPALPGAQQVVSVGTNPPGVNSYEYGDILFFRMCASGPNCAIVPGTDDPNVLAPILARQSYELALHGLHNVEEAEFVMVLLPPGFATAPGQTEQPRVVHFYRRKDLEDALDRPINETLPGTPPPPSALSPSDAEAFEALTAGSRHVLQSGTDNANTLNVYQLTPLG